MRNIKIRFIETGTHEVKEHIIRTDLYDDLSRVDTMTSFIHQFSDGYLPYQFPFYDLIEINVSKILAK